MHLIPMQCASVKAGAWHAQELWNRAGRRASAMPTATFSLRFRFKGSGQRQARHAKQNALANQGPLKVFAMVVLALSLKLAVHSVT